MPQQVDLLFRNGTIITMDTNRRVLTRGDIAVSGGRIVAVEKTETTDYVATTTVDASNRVLLPGFVDAHDHLISGFVRGLGGAQFVNVGGTSSDMPTMRLREAMDEEACYWGARLSLLELLKTGVTTLADSQAAMAGKERMADGALRAITESGVRALYTRASQNRTEFLSPKYWDSIDRAIPELDRLSATWSSDKIEVGAEAQGLHRVEEDILHALKAWSLKKGVHFAMHISYSQDAANHSVERFGKRLLTLLEEWGVLDDHFIGFHPVWLDDAEIAALARTGAGVSWCPVDNALIASGVAPVAKLRAAGVRLGLGVDQPNDSHNVFELMKIATLIERLTSNDATVAPPEQALELATIGGARAMHRDHEVGSLEVGKHADIVLLDAESAALSPAPGRISNLVLAASPDCVKSVYIGGEEVVRDGIVLAFDEHETSREVNRVVREAWRRAGMGDDPLPVTSWPVS